jgi:prephenate dehydrogenase
MRPTIGIIGYGRFGRVAARWLSAYARVVVHDPALGSRPRMPSGVRAVNLEVAAGQPVVILCVPISALEAVLMNIRGHVSPGCVVLDVCSVKSLPVKWMTRLLPRSVSVIGTHPLFGPDSVGATPAGHRIVLCPGRAPGAIFRMVRRLLRSGGVIAEVMTPAAHDRLMAETLLFAQYVGRLPAAAGIPLHSGSTPSYGFILGLTSVAMNDTEQLFLDMWRYNPFGNSVRRRISSGHRRLERKITRFSR